MTAPASARAKGPRPGICVTLGALRQMKNLPEEWRVLVEDAADLSDLTTVSITAERAEIVGRECI